VFLFYLCYAYFLFFCSHHSVHFQIVDKQVAEGKELLFAEIGDYRDTIILASGINFTIRFIPAFLGRIMVHCHILKHEDGGMMMLVNVTPPLEKLPKLGMAQLSASKSKKNLWINMLLTVLISICSVSFFLTSFKLYNFICAKFDCKHGNAQERRTLVPNNYMND
jgi:hypothetical protein